MNATERTEIRLIRLLTPTRLASHVLEIRAQLGASFDYSTLGKILSRATDEELLALHRPKAGE